MLLSAKYICPKRGLAELEPPEPQRLGQAARVAESLGLDQLLLPILEESLTGTAKERVRFLDGLIMGLDRVAESNLRVSLIFPAQEILGLCWAIRDLLRATQRSDAFSVYVQGKVRTLCSSEWWLDPLLIQKRVRTFREVVSAVSRHSALAGWLVLDGVLDRTSPDPRASEFVLKSFLGEIKEKGGGEKTRLSLGWFQLVKPSLARPLVGLVDGVLLSGSEKPFAHDPRDVEVATYLGVMARWVFDRSTEVEIGWDLTDKGFDPENLVREGERLAEHGLEGACWVSLCDPEPGLKTAPPWSLKPGLAQVGLLDFGLEPKPWVEAWISQMRSTKPKQGRNDFIDLSLEEYLDNPSMHLTRLWNHFRVLN